MFSETTISSGVIKGFYRSGKLLAISATLLSASAGMSFATQYPVSTVAVQSASIDRPCTKFELSANMAPAECGTLTLADVASRIHALERDNRGD